MFASKAQTMYSLAELNISNNKITGQVLNSLADLFKENKSLYLLDMSRNKIKLVGYSPEYTLNTINEDELKSFLKLLQQRKKSLTSLVKLNIEPAVAYLNYFDKRSGNVQKSFHKETETLISDIQTSGKAKVDDLFTAAQSGNLPKIQEMVRDKSVSLYAPDPQSGDTALHVAVKYQKNRVVAFLLQHCHPYTRNNQDQDILELAQSPIDNESAETKAIREELVESINRSIEMMDLLFNYWPSHRCFYQ